MRRLRATSEPVNRLKTGRKKWCPGWESNPHEEKSPEDFKSSASAIPPPGRWHYKSSGQEHVLQHYCVYSRSPADQDFFRSQTECEFPMASVNSIPECSLFVS